MTANPAAGPYRAAGEIARRLAGARRGEPPRITRAPKALAFFERRPSAPPWDRLAEGQRRRLDRGRRQADPLARAKRARTALFLHGPRRRSRRARCETGWR